MSLPELAPIAPLPEGDLEFGPFRLLRELGRGGMGTVYLAEVLDAPLPDGDASAEVGDVAHRPPPGTRVALKTFHPHLVESKEFARRFRREARTGAAIQHPNVVRTFEAGTAALRGVPTSYMAMEYVEGQTLRELIRELGQVPPALACAVARQAASGLAAIHAAGVTHRDVKPENVIITSDHRVKLMDLGVAKLREASIRLSMTGQFLGSVHYASPEQFRSPDAVDARTDLYALGVLLHEMLTGENPFFHDDIRVVLRKTVAEMPRRVSQRAPETPPFLDQLAWTLLQKDPAHRVQTAAEVEDALERGEDSAWWTSVGAALWSQSSGRLARRLPVARETRLVGREEELRELRRIFESAAQGERQAVLVEGEAGVGKTRLLDEFAAGLAEEGVSFHLLYGAAAPPGSGRPFHSVSEALLGVLDPNDLPRSVAALLPTGAPAEAFADLLRGATGSAPLPPDQVRALFAAALRALAAQKPVLLVLDDFHLASENTAHLVSYLFRDDRSSRVLAAACFRPPDEGHALFALAHGAREPNVTHLALPRLAARDVGALLRETLRSERLVQELGFRLMEKTEGNPFFVLEVLRTLQRDRVLLRRDDGAWTLAGSKVEIHVPDSVKELVHTGLARLADADRELLDLASVLGAEFDPDLLAEAAGTPKLQVLKRLSQLERRHRLVRSAGRRCRFDHHQLRETLYGELMDGLREEYHAAVGACLEQRAERAEPDGAARFDLAWHLSFGGRGERAAAHVVPALAHAASNYRTDEGARLASRFLDAAGAAAGRETRAEVLLALAEFHEHDGRRPEQRAALDRAAEALRGAASPDLARRVDGRRLLLHFRLGEFEAAETACRAALSAAMVAGDLDAAAAAAGNLGSALRSLGRYDEAASRFQQAIDEFLPDTSVVRRCLLLGSLGAVESHRGRGRQAQVRFLEAMRIAEGLGLGGGGAAPEASLPGDDLREQFEGLVRALGRYAESRIDGERLLLLQTDLPRRLREAAALLSLGVLGGALARPADARRCLAGALAACREAGDARFEAVVLHALGECALAARDAVAARRDLEAALALRRRIGHRPGVCETLLALGQLASLCGEAPAARVYLDEATELAPALDMPAIAALARATAAMLHAREGRPDRARAELAEAERVLQAAGPLSVCSRAEGLYFAALAARALGDEAAYASRMRAAWETLRAVADRLPPSERGPFLTGTSPNREIHRFANP